MGVPGQEGFHPPPPPYSSAPGEPPLYPQNFPEQPSGEQYAHFAAQPVQPIGIKDIL